MNAADLTACILEIFDGDGSDPTAAPDGSYPGTTGCDANADHRIDAGDLSCTVRILFRGSHPCGREGAHSSVQTAPAMLWIAGATATAGTTVDVPIHLTTNGAAVAAAAFMLTFDLAALSFDPTDGNGDTLPDALHLTLPALMEQPLITVTTHTGALDVAFTALAATPVTWYDGVLLTVTLQVNEISGDSPVTTTLVFDPSIPPSLGSATGTSIPVQTANGLVQITPPAAPSRLYLPLIMQE